MRAGRAAGHTPTLPLPPAAPSGTPGDPTQQPLDSGAQLRVPARLEAPPGQPASRTTRTGRGQESALCRVVVAREWGVQPPAFMMRGDGVGSRPAARSTRAGVSLCRLPSGQIYSSQGQPRPRLSRAHPTLGVGCPPPGEAWEMGEVVRLVSGAELGIHAGWQALGGWGRGRLERPPQEGFVFDPPRRLYGMGV